MAVLVERANQTACDVGEVKTLLTTMTERLSSFQQESIRVHEQLASRIEINRTTLVDHRTDIDSNNDRIKVIEDAIKPLLVANKILTWVAITAGGVLITGGLAFLWMVLTHQLSVLYP